MSSARSGRSSRTRSAGPPSCGRLGGGAGRRRAAASRRRRPDRRGGGRGARLGRARLQGPSRRLAVEHLRSSGRAAARDRARPAPGVAAASSERGYDHLGLDVLTTNRDARAVYDRLGFSEHAVSMSVQLADLEARLGDRPRGESSGRVYVQTDDETFVERAVSQFVPRLGRSARTDVSVPRNGWIEVDDDLCSRDPRALRRLGQELSYRTGGVVLTLGIEEGAVVRYVLFDRGSVADEYASLPEYYGPLPPGDIVALGANPTVVQRLTGAAPEQVRAVAKTASSPDELPPPEELHARLADVLGVGSEAE